MIRRPPRSTLSSSSAASDVYKRQALAVQGLARGHLDPALAEAVFLHIESLLVVQANADAVLEDGGEVMRAARIDGETIGQGKRLGCVVHGVSLTIGRLQRDRGGAGI